MDDKHAELRAALDRIEKSSHPDVISSYRFHASPEAIRALLADKDGLEVAVKEAAEVIISRNDEVRRLREALVKLLAGARAETAESWQCSSYHPDLIAGMGMAATALAEGQPHDS